MSLINYIKETRSEMKHVSWPSKKETTNFTVIVIALSILVGALLGLFDFIFSYILKLLIM